MDGPDFFFFSFVANRALGKLAVLLLFFSTMALTLTRTKALKSADLHNDVGLCLNWATTIKTYPLISPLPFFL